MAATRGIFRIWRCARRRERILTTQFAARLRLPPISDIHSLTLAEGEFVRNIGVNIRFYEGWDE